MVFIANKGNERGLRLNANVRLRNWARVERQ